MESEYSTMHLVRKESQLPVPHVHVLEANPNSNLEMFTIRLPKTGKIVGINDDGSYRQGPLPGIGGPFNTAADEILPSAEDFKSLVHGNAERLSSNNMGPFPLCHGDFGHKNIVFDDKYRLLGVIDWETAFAGPSEISGEFPLSISVVPPDMDVPWKYDEAGNLKEAEDRQRFAEREDYVAIVKQEEEERGLTGKYSLSSALQDANRQYLATAMRIYTSGKPGWYSKVIERFSKD
ncbi:hypothetical protein BDV25DRAFT_134827 [Aspergillus avenaceus]|uniref:Aminoglycoside phosphotransferase domain-containing protein n=1 Tax=Aspergillus avenaceus TaxID=36643 RepID=A0A5N6TCZ6_ASPAV|nr:hypothetical protein BDV25DRAFT_134827 [Aspergillus avenaceus]